MKKTLLAAALLLPLTLSACSGLTDPALIGVASLLTDTCWVAGRPLVVSVSTATQPGQLDVTYYRSDTTLAHREFSMAAAPFLASLPGSLSWPVTPPTRCD